MDSSLTLNRPKTIWLFEALAAVHIIATIIFLYGGDKLVESQLERIKLSGDLNKAIHLTEAFAHGSGVIAILGSLLWIDQKNRAMLLRATILTVCASGLANALKFVFTRIRPHATLEGMTVDESWLPNLTGSFWDATHRSFPSGHAATAVALAVGLTMVYPRGRYIFAALGFLACMQRILSKAHYPSDVAAGATIAFVVVLITQQIWRNKDVEGRAETAR